MTKVAIIYYSGSGHTEKLAYAVQNGAASIDGIFAKCYSVDNLNNDLSELESFDAMIFGSPSYMGSVASDFKLFLEKTSKLWSTQKWKNKIAAGFTNSKSMSGDKLNVLIQLAIFAAQHSMIWVGLSEMDASVADNPGDPNAINRIGSFLGAMAQSGDSSLEITPPKGDIATAFSLGKRVAKLAVKY